MDAKITKQRLATLLSYDWLKIIAAVAVAVFLVVVLFLTTATRATNAQTFTVYTYTDVSAGDDFLGLADALKKNVFSYDVLETRTENFSSDSQYDILSLRRSTGAGTVMFISDVRVYATDEDGSQQIAQESALRHYAEGSAVDMEHATAALVYDTQYYFEMSETYLEGFFGAGLAADEPAADRVRESFLSRNGSDKRFRSNAAKEAGIVQERQRLLDLKEDYLFVCQLFERGVYRHTVYETTDMRGVEYESALGINVGGLADIADLAYYADDDGKAVTEQLNLIIFYNDYHEANGLLYEPITFLRWLYEEYGA